MLHEFGFSTSAEEVAAALSDRIKGKTILITGCTKGGIGFEAARALSLQSPKLLILAGRRTSTLEEAKQIIHSTSPNVAVKPLQLDLSSLSAVGKAANEILNDPDVSKIDALINNAGIMAPPYSKSVDGFESQLATNHLGHFLLTNLLMPRILAAGPGSRIVNVSSRGHRRGPFRFDDPNFSDGATYNSFLGYGQSKTANMLFSVGLAERLGAKGIGSYSLHPGIIMTNLAKNMGPEAMQQMKELGLLDENGQPKNPSLWKNLGQGAATSVVAAFDPRIEDRNGAYLSDCKVEDEIVEPYAVDKGNAERLWKLSEDMVGLKFSH